MKKPTIFLYTKISTLILLLFSLSCPIVSAVDSVAEHESIGEQHYAEKNYNAAISEFLIVLQKDPTNRDALKYMGLCYNAKQDYDTAITYFDQLLAISPNDARYIKYKNDAVAAKGGSPLSTRSITDTANQNSNPSAGSTTLQQTQKPKVVITRDPNTPRAPWYTSIYREIGNYIYELWVIIGGPFDQSKSTINNPISSDGQIGSLPGSQTGSQKNDPILYPFLIPDPSYTQHTDSAHGYITTYWKGNGGFDLIYHDNIISTNSQESKTRYETSKHPVKNVYFNAWFDGKDLLFHIIMVGDKAGETCSKNPNEPEHCYSGSSTALGKVGSDYFKIKNWKYGDPVPNPLVFDGEDLISGKTSKYSWRLEWTNDTVKGGFTGNKYIDPSCGTYQRCERYFESLPESFTFDQKISNQQKYIETLG